MSLPYQDNIAALLHEPTFRRVAGEAVFAKARYINTLRNRAVHEEKRISDGDARGAVKELFHVCFWLARTYAREAKKPADSLAFDAAQLTRRDDVLKRALVQLKAQQAELDDKNGELTKLLASSVGLDEEVKRLRAEVAAARKNRRGDARHPRLRRSRDPRPLHRSAAARGRLGARRKGRH